MQTEVVAAMGRRPVIVHGHAGSLIGWSQRGGFPGDDQKPVGPVEYEAKEVHYADHV